MKKWEFLPFLWFVAFICYSGLHQLLRMFNWISSSFAGGGRWRYWRVGFVGVNAFSVRETISGTCNCNWERTFSIQILSDGVEVQTKQKLLLTSFRAVWTLIWKTIIKQLTHWIWLIIFSILCFGYVPHMALLLCADLCGISNLDYVWTFSYKCYICAVECCCEKSHAVSTYCWMDKLGHMFDTRTFHPNDIPCAVANWFVF